MLPLSVGFDIFTRKKKKNKNKNKKQPSSQSSTTFVKYTKSGTIGSFKKLDNHTILVFTCPISQAFKRVTRGVSHCDHAIYTKRYIKAKEKL
jgi:hypothetical protein